MDDGDHLVPAHEVAGSHAHVRDAVVRGEERVLHLHGLDGDEDVPGGDGLAVRGGRHDRAGHRGAHLGVGRAGRVTPCPTAVGPRPSRALRNLARVYTEGDTDLAWTRATLWRGLIAATLDQPPYEPVRRAVVTGESTHPSVDLMAAWLAHALRCPVEIERVPGAPAITQVRLERASGDIVLDRPDGKTAALRQPDQPEHRIALPIRQLRECLVEELRRLDADEVYGEVLQKGLARIDA